MTPTDNTDAKAEDDYARAVMFATRDKASCSYVQRRMGIGYNKAASFLERMEREGLISRAKSSGLRTILVPWSGPNPVPAKPEGEGAPGVRETIFRALRDYNMTNMGQEDDWHLGYPLVDLMSNDGTEISTGEAEMRVLADHLAEALESASPPVPAVAGEHLRGEVTDEWAERFCEAVNWSPDGQECKTVEGQMRCVSFRDLAKGYILSAIATDPTPSADQSEVIGALAKALGRFIRWGEAQCPCYNEEPNPCTLCGASVENLENCKAVEKKFPPDILAEARQALAAHAASIGGKS